MSQTTSLADRIARLERLLEQSARECAEMERLDQRQAGHMADTCEDLRGMISRLKAEAARLDAVANPRTTS